MVHCAKENAMENTQLRLFNAFKRSGFNEGRCYLWMLFSIMEKVCDVSDICKDLSAVRERLARIETKVDIGFVLVIALLVKIAFL